MALFHSFYGLRLYHFKWSKLGKDKYHGLSLICGSKNTIQMNLFINTKQYGLTNIENKFMVTKEDSGGGQW